MLRQLNLYYVFVSLPLVLLILGATFFFEAIKGTISRNPHPQINYTIFIIIFFGGIIIIFNARRLIREAKALVEFSGAIHRKTDSMTLKELANSYICDIACLLQMVASSGDRSISHQEQAALEHELSNVGSRLNRRNALPQYLTGLLVGMGLLGTFIGLLATLGDITALISSFADLDMSTADPIVVFRNMITKMKAPMQSMAIAFSASMFGLLGSIILGLMMVGIRRLQGDVFSLLSSEVARHIEMALSFEKITFSGGDVAIGNSSAGDLSTNILMRIEERLSENARVRQRALTAEIDDFKKQRADMLQNLADQTEASNNFRSGLQQLGGQLGAIFSSMEKSNGAISSQISELTVHMSSAAKESHKLLAMQVDEQKNLKASLDSYNVDERLAETARVQERMLSTVIDDFHSQRTDMQRALTEQTEASNKFRGELQQLNSQLGTIFVSMENGNGEISNQLSELTVHMAADAKQSHLLLTNATNTFRHEVQHLGNKISTGMTTGTDEITGQLTELMNRISTETKGLDITIDNANSDLRNELQQLGSQLSSSLDTGNGEISARISELMTRVSTETKESHQLIDRIDSGIRSELQQLTTQLGSVSSGVDKGNAEVCSHISELMTRISAEAKESHVQIDSANNDLRSELQQLGTHLGSISTGVERGNGEICAQLSELSDRMVAEPVEQEEQVI